VYHSCTQRLSGIYERIADDGLGFWLFCCFKLGPVCLRLVTFSVYFTAFDHIHVCRRFHKNYASKRPLWNHHICKIPDIHLRRGHKLTPVHCLRWNLVWNNRPRVCCYVALLYPLYQCIMLPVKCTTSTHDWYTPLTAWKSSINNINSIWIAVCMHLPSLQQNSSSFTRFFQKITWCNLYWKSPVWNLTVYIGIILVDQERMNTDTQLRSLTVIFLAFHLGVGVKIDQVHHQSRFPIIYLFPLPHPISAEIFLSGWELANLRGTSSIPREYKNPCIVTSKRFQKLSGWIMTLLSKLCHCYLRFWATQMNLPIFSVSYKKPIIF